MSRASVLLASISAGVLIWLAADRRHQRGEIAALRTELARLSRSTAEARETASAAAARPCPERVQIAAPSAPAPPPAARAPAPAAEAPPPLEPREMAAEMDLAFDREAADTGWAGPARRLLQEKLAAALTDASTLRLDIR